ncbi:MAG: hypothetical protein JHC38_01725 [Thiotrichales bacterium]|jgi:hypothetical protein|nr:hypothetical protein [Thiotrichales bacterium]
MDIAGLKQQLIDRINTVSTSSTSLEDLSYASAALAKLNEIVPQNTGSTPILSKASIVMLNGVPALQLV